jgi:hypothetical protein
MADLHVWLQIRGGCSLAPTRWLCLVLFFGLSVSSDFFCLSASGRVVAVASAAAAPAASYLFHPRICTILVHRLQRQWSFLLQQVAANDIRDIVTSHYVPVKICPARRAVQAMDAHLSYKVGHFFDV